MRGGEEETAPRVITSGKGATGNKKKSAISLAGTGKAHGKRTSMQGFKRV